MYRILSIPARILPRILPRIFSTLAFICILAFTLYSCRDKNDTSDMGPNTGTTVEGVVTNLDGSPMIGVTVRSGQDSSVTDGAGHYKMYNGLIEGDRALVAFRKEGFFEVTNGALKQERGGTVINAVLLQKVLLGSFDNSAGGQVSSNDGLTFTFQSNGFKQANGLPYSGKIRIYGANIDATHPRFGEMMPGGDFMAEDPDNPGQQGILESVGAFYIDAAGGIGNKSAGGMLKSAQVDSIVPVLPNVPFGVCITVDNQIADVIRQWGLTTLKVWRNVAGIWSKASFNVLPIVPKSAESPQADPNRPEGGAPAGPKPKGNASPKVAEALGRLKRTYNHLLKIEVLDETVTFYEFTIGLRERKFSHQVHQAIFLRNMASAPYHEFAASVKADLDLVIPAYFEKKHTGEPITLKGNIVCTQVISLGGYNFGYLRQQAELVGRVCKPSGGAASSVPIRFGQQVVTTNSVGEFNFRVLAGRKLWLNTPFGSRQVGPLIFGQNYDLKDTL